MIIYGSPRGFPRKSKNRNNSRVTKLVVLNPLFQKTHQKRLNKLRHDSNNDFLRECLKFDDQSIGGFQKSCNEQKIVGFSYRDYFDRSNCFRPE
jgi:hypothetical protein